MNAVCATLLGLALMLECSKAGELAPFKPKSTTDGYCEAGGREDDKAIGGYFRSANSPKKLIDKTSGRDGKISLVAMPSEAMAFRGGYQGFRLLFLNRTASEAAFDACDSRLNVICEARDQDGKWKPIEELPSSFCGNSYHHAYLPSGHYWEFAAPTYSGMFKTKLRFHLIGKRHIYSNEFEGRIDPVQFNKAAGRK